MYLKQITNKKNKKIFRDYPVQCKQNKRIAGNIHSTQTRKRKELNIIEKDLL